MQRGEEPQVFRARLAGAVYLLYLGMVEVAWVVSRTRPAAGVDAVLASNLLDLMAAVLLFGLLKPVSLRVAVEALAFSIVGNALGMLHCFGVARQVHAIPFLACFLGLTGWLMLRSGFVPKVIGWLMLACGAGWLLFFIPAVSRFSQGRLSTMSFALEGVAALWLLIRGVDAEKWRLRARMAATEAAQN